MKRSFHSLWGRALVLLVLAVPVGWAGAATPPAESKAQRFTLANGMTLIVKPDRRAPTVAHMLWVRVGAMDEVDGTSGVAHALEHMMFKGTPDMKPGEFSRQVAALGGRDNAFTSRDATAYHQQVPAQALDAQGRYEAAMRRGDDGRFGPLILKELAADDSSMQLQLRPSSGEPGAIDFSLEARQWAVPGGPRTRWNHVQASGSLRGNVLEVSSYALTGFFGITTGKLFVAGDVEWVVTGMAEAGKVDVETVLESLRGQTQGSPATQPAAMQGTAALDLVMLGRGATPADIAHEQGVKISTVRTQITAIRQKTGTSTIQRFFRLNTALTERHGPSPMAFLLVPIVGAFFADIANALVLQAFFALPALGF